MARADSANASCGCSSSAAAAGGEFDRANTATSSAHATYSLGRQCGFGGDPVEVGCESIDDRDDDNLGKFVGVGLADGFFDGRVAVAACLDRYRHFFCCFDFTAPVIN